MAKKKKINLKKFIPFCLICAAFLYFAGYGIGKLLAKKPIIKTCEHIYVDGVCTKCGEKDPDYVEPVDPQSLWPRSSTKESKYPLASSSDDILVLVNKTHTITESYIPDDLVEVKYYDPEVGRPDLGTRKVRAVVAEAFNKLSEDAKAEGLDIVLRNGYRSYDYQTSLYNSYAAKYGQAEADKFSAKPGTSEHQTGWALDVGITGVYLDNFTGTPEAKWLKENCYKYGFILRYQDGTLDEPGEITGYIAESWHIRYVGLEAAKIIYENDLTLEEYSEIVEKYN